MVSRGNHLTKAKEREGTWSICKTVSPYLGLDQRGPVGKWGRIMIGKPAEPQHKGFGSMLRVLSFFLKMEKHH